MHRATRLFGDLLAHGRSRHRDCHLARVRLDLVSQQRQEGPLVPQWLALVVDYVRDLASWLQEDAHIGTGVAHVLGEALEKGAEFLGGEYRPSLVDEGIEGQSVASEPSENRRSG